MKLLVLYEELAPYFLVNIERFADAYQIPVMIICKSVNPVAPFKFEVSSPYIQIIYRDGKSLEELFDMVKQFNPTCLMQAGWIFKPYFEITRKLNLRRNILLLDNQWKNTFRQNIGSIYFKWKYKKLFHKALVPGLKQKEFAKHLGFDDRDIEIGFYCCDTPLFESVYVQRKSRKKRNYTFLYTGRYAEEKNVEMLWKAFAELCDEYPNNWQLMCVGKGDIPPYSHKQITHLGFLQPKELLDVLYKTDVFVLPSKFEPWGVVIHEMATAGLPVISSSEVGANEFFVKHNENGFIFHPEDKAQLKKHLRTMMELKDEEYFRMCDKSYELSQQINTQDWIKKIYHLCKL